MGSCVDRSKFNVESDNTPDNSKRVRRKTKYIKYDQYYIKGNSKQEILNSIIHNSKLMRQRIKKKNSSFNNPKDEIVTIRPEIFRQKVKVNN